MAFDINLNRLHECCMVCPCRNLCMRFHTLFFSRFRNYFWCALAKFLFDALLLCNRERVAGLFIGNTVVTFRQIFAVNCSDMQNASVSPCLSHVSKLLLFVRNVLLMGVWLISSWVAVNGCHLKPACLLSLPIWHTYNRASRQSVHLWTRTDSVTIRPGMRTISLKSNEVII